MHKCESFLPRKARKRSSSGTESGDEIHAEHLLPISSAAMRDKTLSACDVGIWGWFLTGFTGLLGFMSETALWLGFYD